jgi:hypothetical protein
MILDRPPRFSVFMMLLAAGVAWRAAPLARCADAGKGTQAAHPVSLPFVLTVQGPDGRALARVAVQIRYEPAIDAAQVREGKFLRSEPGAVFVESNASGRVAIELAPGVGQLDCCIEMPGFAPQAVRWKAVFSPLSPITMQLAPAWSVGGIVVDGEGKPIEGARVTPRLNDLRIDPLVNGLSGMQRRENQFAQPCGTDFEGKWHYDCVPISRGEFRCAIDHPQFAPERRSLSRAEFGCDAGRPPTARIVLRPGLTIGGKVMDDEGAPISGARIRARLPNALREGTSGADGVYHLRGCEAGVATFVASAKGRAMQTRSLWIGPAASTVDTRLDPASSLSLRVVDENDRPCAEARVHLLPPHSAYDDVDNRFEFANIDQRVDQDGRWEWSEAPQERVIVSVEFPGGVRYEGSCRPLPDEEYVIKQPTYLPVTGTVVDRATRQSIKHFRVLAGSRADNGDCYYFGAKYAEDGRYQVQFGVLPPKRVLRIEADGYQPAISRDIKVEEKTASVNFELIAGQNLEGVVLTPAGLPAAGATIALATGPTLFAIVNGDLMVRENYWVEMRQTDASGHFHFPPPDRHYYLAIVHPSGYAWFEPIPRSNRRRITLDPWSRIEGTYRVGGKAAAGVPMSLTSQVPPPLGDAGLRIVVRSQTTTGRDGGYDFDRVPACSGEVGRLLRWAPRLGHPEPESACMATSNFPLGKAVRIEFGQNGRAVIGRLRPPRGFDKPLPWQFATVTIFPRSENAVADRRWYQASIDSAGRFRFDDLPPGQYTIQCQSVAFIPCHLDNRVIFVPSEDVRPLDQPLDLGEMELQKN